MPRDSAAADRPASYLVGTAAAFPLFFRDRTKPINQLPFSPSAKFPKSGSSCEGRVNRIGNLVLLPAKSNSTLGSSAFNVKTETFKSAPYELTRQVSTVPQWDAGTIMERQKLLAELALRTWPL
jgi:hypothetical protein